MSQLLVWRPLLRQKAAVVRTTIRDSLSLESAAWQLIINANSLTQIKLEQLERLRSEDTSRRPMITHTIDQFILNPKSILLTSSYQIPNQNKMKAEKFVKNWNFRILL